MTDLLFSSNTTDQKRKNEGRKKESYFLLFSSYDTLTENIPKFDFFFFSPSSSSIILRAPYRMWL